MKELNQKLAVTAAGLTLLAGTNLLRADEQLFGLVRGAETLPQGRSELYQFVTLRTGKAEGSYYGLDFDTEVEHGFTDKFQADLSVENRYFDNHGVNGDRDALDDTDQYRFGGVTAAAKYRVLSTFEDPIGLAFRVEGGYLFNDEVDGLAENEFYIAPEADLQKDFRDDTLITAAWLGAELAWGKRPAEFYTRELAWQGGAGVAWRFAPNWFIGVEADTRAEYPMFDLNNFEHVVIYAGPSLHYSAKHWWVTLTYFYQAWGNGVDEPADGRTYAEETDMQILLKVGFNF
jgi:Family of unknown function (DUF6662)